MMTTLLNNLGKSRSKSKTPEEQCPPCPNTFLNYMPQPSTLYTYQPQPHIQPTQTYHQHQVYQQTHQPIQAMPLSSCPHQCQSHIIQSPQQSVTYPVHNHLRNNTLDPRPTDQAMVLNNQIQAPVPQATQQFVTMPAYQGDQVQPVPISTQSSRYSDNSYYSNHMASLTLQQQQQQKFQLDEQRQRFQQQQHSQHQTDSQQRHKQLQQQQQYQNHQMVNEVANGHSDGGLSLEVLCYMHERDNEELLKLAASLKSDLAKLAGELDVIRRETPEYSVSEVKI